jgi:hypothetical protein
MSRWPHGVLTVSTVGTTHRSIVEMLTPSAFGRVPARVGETLDVRGLDEFVKENMEPAAPTVPRRPAGRPSSLPESVVGRIRFERERGQSLGEIARMLTAEGCSDRPRWKPLVAVHSARRPSARRRLIG